MSYKNTSLDNNLAIVDLITAARSEADRVVVDRRGVDGNTFFPAGRDKKKNP